MIVCFFKFQFQRQNIITHSSFIVIQLRIDIKIMITNPAVEPPPPSPILDKTEQPYSHSDPFVTTPNDLQMHSQQQPAEQQQNPPQIHEMDPPSPRPEGQGFPTNAQEDPLQDTGNFQGGGRQGGGGGNFHVGGRQGGGAQGGGAQGGRGGGQAAAASGQPALCFKFNSPAGCSIAPAGKHSISSIYLGFHLIFLGGACNRNGRVFLHRCSKDKQGFQCMAAHSSQQCK